MKDAAHVEAWVTSYNVPSEDFFYELLYLGVILDSQEVCKGRQRTPYVLAQLPVVIIANYRGIFVKKKKPTSVH